MDKLKRLAWSLCLLLACGLIVLPAVSGHLRHFADTHAHLRYLLLLSVLLTVPASLITLAAAFLLERLLVGWQRSSLATLWRPGASVKLDVLSIAMTLLPLRRLGYVLSLGLLFGLDAGWLPANVSLTRLLPLWGVQAGCLLLFQSFLSYWIHRLEHAIPALWALHKFHHSADRMSILNSERRTQLAKGVEEVLLFIPLALLGNPTLPKPTLGSAAFLTVLVYAAFRTFTGINMYFCHSNLTTGYGWIGRWLLVSPRMHRLHHAASPRYYNSNYTFDLVIWDRLFGTYATCDVATAARLTLGLEDNPFNARNSLGGALRDYLFVSYVVFWHELRRGFKAWWPQRLDRGRSPAATPRPLSSAPP